MKYIKLFEDYSTNQYTIMDSKLELPYLYFWLNEIRFKIDINKLEVINYKFIDEQSPTLKFIKSDKFVDDLQEL